MGAAALPASAQVVIGGSGQPSVEVNWSVLDRLGRQPTLADMLKNEAPATETRSAATNGAGNKKAIQYRPYKAEKPQPAAKKLSTAPAQPKVKKPAITPVAAKVERPVSPAVAELVEAARKPAPKAEAAPKLEGPKVELPKVAQPPVPPKPVMAAVPETAKPEPAKPEPVKQAGPQISLPEVPKPVQIAKVEAPVAPPAPAPAPAAKAEPVSLVTALTPPPAPVVKPEPAPQLASVPASGFKGDTLTIGFGADSARLPDSVHGELDKLVKRMQKDDGLGLQLLAYAEGDDANASKARRLSLSRALEVRKYLMEQGLRSTRIEVRALGNKMEGSGPGDRVDAVVVSR